jgi:pimeloyl-ACP methyl ester carboxylesterase
VLVDKVVSTYLVPRLAAKRPFAVALVGIALATLSSTAAAQTAYPDPAGYCQAQSTRLDPADLGPLALDALPVGLHERFIDLAGIRTPLLESGPASSSTALVFVHGNPGSSRDFTELIAAAHPLGMRTVAFDMPGFGRAARPWSFRYTLDGYLHWFADALVQLGVHHAILVVHDLGGPLAMQWAAEHPDQFVATAIIDSGVLVGYQDHYLARTWKTPVGGESFMQATTHEVFDTGIQNGQQRPLPPSFVDRMYAEYDRPTRCAILSAYRSVPDVDALARRQAAVLAPLNRPALVVWGAHDPYLPPDLAYAQREAFPSAQIHVLDDAAHWPFVDDRAQVSNLVTTFLAGLAPRRTQIPLVQAPAPSCHHRRATPPHRRGIRRRCRTMNRHGRAMRHHRRAMRHHRRAMRHHRRAHRHSRQGRAQRS